MSNEANEQEEIAALQRQLAAILARCEEGTHETAIPALKLIRSNGNPQPIHSIYNPSLCIVAQGSKLVMLGKESYRYNPSTYLVASVHLPITGRIVEATPEQPYLSLQLDFSTEQIIELLKEFQTEKPSVKGSERGLIVSTTSPSLLGAVLRLVRLLDSLRDIPALAPLIIREILYWILRDEQGAAVLQFAVAGSHAERIAKVIRIIQNDFAKPLRIEALAKAANMSPSSLHAHFKKVTAMSPLQYQKHLRLQEARRLLLSDRPEAANVGFMVGFESPSQFSREYARLFGLPPLKDVKRLRESLA